MPEGCRFMAVVKANAYGHGDVFVARHLNRLGIFDFAVATLEEGIALRQNNILGTILILGHTPPQAVPLLLRYDLTQTVVDFGHGQALGQAAQMAGQVLKVHIKIDTGMHRLGLSPADPQQLEVLMANDALQVTGMFTHLCCCDSLAPDDRSFTQAQIAQFMTLVDALKARGLAVPPIHIQSSYGLINAPGLPCSYARIGIMMYGCFSQKDPQLIAIPDLWPVLSLHSYIASIRHLHAGDTVGYGRTFRAQKDRTIAVIPAGYGDGYPRSISGKGFVLIHGQRAPIIGRICMDQMTVDISGIPNVQTGDAAVLIGRQGREEIRAEELAGWADTITNEILCRLGTRIRRTII